MILFSSDVSLQGGEAFFQDLKRKRKRHRSHGVGQVQEVWTVWYQYLRVQLIVFFEFNTL